MANAIFFDMMKVETYKWVIRDHTPEWIKELESKLSEAIVTELGYEKLS